MPRSRRLLLIAGLLVLAGLVPLTWHLFRQQMPNFFDAEMVDADELQKLQAAELTTPPPTVTDWPQYRGPNRDGIAAADNFNTDWEAKKPTLAWKTACGGGYGSVAVSDGRVYVQDRRGESERLVCFAATDGKELWADAYAADYSPLRAGYAEGPRGTPTIYDGRAYTVGAVGQFRCVKLNGDAPPELLWEHDLRAEYAADLSQQRWGFACSPLIDGDLVIVQACGAKGSVVAFDRLTGEQRWTAGDDVGGYSSPVVATLAGRQQVVAVTGTTLMGIDPADGTTLWEYPWQTQHNANAASPVVTGDFVFISSDYGKGCAVVRVTETGVRPVYFKKGNNGLKTHHSTVVHRDGFVYGFDMDELRCLNLRDGTFVGEWEATPGIDRGSVLRVGDTLLVQCKSGALHLIAADPTEFRPLGSLKGVVGGNTWGTPAVLDGRIYTRDGSNVLCVDATK